MTEERLLEIMTALAKEMGMVPEDLLELFDTFIDEMTEDIFKLKIAYQKGNFIDLKNISHNIKGVSANLKFDEMFVEAKALNDKLKEETFDDLYKHIEAMTKAFYGFKAAFLDYFNR